MRLLVGVVLVMGMGCGGTPSIRDVCEKSTECFADEANPAPTQQQIDQAIAQCVASGTAANPSDDCLDCLDGLSCAEVVSDSDECDTVCDDEDVQTGGSGTTRRFTRR